MHKLATSVLLIALSTITVVAQSAPTTQPSEASEPEKGFLSYVDFGGSSNAQGRVFTLGLSAGYEFNRHVSVSARMPIYFASFDGTTIAGTSGSSSTQLNTSNNGIGNPSLAVQLNFPNRVLGYQTRLTTWIPVASKTSGFSTGHVLVDWTSRVSRRVGRFVPFGTFDIANTVPDTPAFILPYTAQGINTRLEGGTNVLLTRIFTIGGSAYDVLPSGKQDVYSRMVNTSIFSSAISGMGGMMGYVNGGNYTVAANPASITANDLTRDHGLSAWVDASVARFVDMELAYSRSYGYKLNTVSFGIGFNIGAALRQHRTR